MKRCLKIVFLYLVASFTWTIGCNGDRNPATHEHPSDAVPPSRNESDNSDGPKEKSYAADKETGSNPVQPADAPNFRLLARNALDASGGDDILRRLQRGRISMDFTGTFAPGMSGNGTIIDTFDGPKRFRREVNMANTEGERARMTFVINDNDAWMESPGQETMRLPAPEQGQDNILLGSFKVLKAIRDGEFSVEPAPDLLDDSSGVTPVNLVSSDGYVGSIVFDNETQFAISSFKTLYDAVTESDVVIATYYEDFQDFHGITIPTRIVALRDQKLFLDTTIQDLELLDSIDASLFEKPAIK